MTKNKDNRGYSSRIVEANAFTAVTSLGVLLGRKCISLDIPVAVVADRMGVSKMTIYKWFTGKTLPRKSQEDRILAFIDELKTIT